MTTLLDAIRAQQHGQMDASPVVVISQEDWDAWDGTDETCPWKLVGWNRWRHEKTGELYEWGQPIVLPWEDH